MPRHTQGAGRDRGLKAIENQAKGNLNSLQMSLESHTKKSVCLSTLTWILRLECVDEIFNLTHPKICKRNFIWTSGHPQMALSQKHKRWNRSAGAKIALTHSFRKVTLHYGVSRKHVFDKQVFGGLQFGAMCVVVKVNLIRYWIELQVWIGAEAGGKFQGSTFTK